MKARNWCSDLNELYQYITMLLRRNNRSRVAKAFAISASFAVLVSTMAFSRTLTRAVFQGTRPLLPTTTSKTSSSLEVLNTPSASPMRNGSPIKIQKNIFSSSSAEEQKQLIRPLIVCGPSGAGKGTIIGKYMSDYGGSEKFAFTVSHTTRKPRPGEIDGVHYHFTDADSIKAAIHRNEFLEYAEVHGNTYGTSLESLSHVQETENKQPILDIDIQGVKSIKAWEKDHENGNESSIEVDNYVDLPELDAKYVFIAPPSLEVLKERLVARGTETKESLEKRTQNAIAEMEYGMEEGNFDAIVINDDLDKACQNFSDIIDRLYAS